MFGLSKRSLNEIDSEKYEMLAVSASTSALAVTMSLLAQSSKRDAQTFMRTFVESLVFAVCLAQMRIQNRFKLNDGNELVDIIQELLHQIRNLPVPDKVSSDQNISLTHEMVAVAGLDAVFEAVSFYSTREYTSLNITDEEIRLVCKVTGQIPSIVKGADWAMALLMFQIRVTDILLDDVELSKRGVPLLTAAQEGCQFMMKKFDGILG